jgi:hypothetical protein
MRRRRQQGEGENGEGGAVASEGKSGDNKFVTFFEPILTDFFKPSSTQSQGKPSTTPRRDAPLLSSSRGGASGGYGTQQRDGGSAFGGGGTSGGYGSNQQRDGGSAFGGGGRNSTGGYGNSGFQRDGGSAFGGGGTSGGYGGTQQRDGGAAYGGGGTSGGQSTKKAYENQKKRVSEDVRALRSIDEGISTGNLTVTCMTCRKAKVKCDKKLPCERCIRLKLSCAPAPPSQRGKRPYVRK